MNTRKTKFLSALLTFVLMATSLWAQGFNASISRAEYKAPKFLLIALLRPMWPCSSIPPVTSATFYGFQAVTTNAAPTTNVATAYVGYLDSDGGSGVTPPRPVILDTIPKGQSITLQRDGVKFNLNQIYVLGTNADKVLVRYEQ
jgi:hypothetical protein